MRAPAAHALVAVLGIASIAGAVDQPISAAKLLVQRLDGQQKLSFLSRDPAFLFPAVGSADAPGPGSPGGMTIELLSPGEAPALLTVTGGTGSSGSGWEQVTRAVATHRYRNPAAPDGPSSVQRVTLKQGRRLQILGKAAGLAVADAASTVAIRITTGTLRSCARFDGDAVRRSEPGRFVGARAAAPAIADCSDASLLGFEPYTCETTGYPICGGTCPDGTGCGPVFGTLAQGGGVHCACAGPGAGCLNGFAYGGDPTEFVPFGCYPIPCAGSYPSCGTTCGDGGHCSPFALDFAAFLSCLCAVPAACDDVEHGYVCPTGQTCRIGAGGTRACAAP